MGSDTEAVEQSLSAINPIIPSYAGMEYPKHKTGVYLFLSTVHGLHSPLNPSQNGNNRSNFLTPPQEFVNVV